jgi:hypothetical protein
MIEVHRRLHVGDLGCCERTDAGRAFVHACKSPCHQHAVGYTGSLPSSHANYLVLRRGEHLYLNLIDPPVPLFKPESFRAFREFAAEQWNAGRELVIHCNQGESRAPSLALLFLAKDLRVISGESFEVARQAFLPLYPRYRPGRGIERFLSEQWDSL